MLLRRGLSLSAALIALLVCSSGADAQGGAPNGGAAAIVPESVEARGSAREPSSAASMLTPPSAQVSAPEAAPKRVPMPWEYAFGELSAIQARETVLWEDRTSLSYGGSAAAIAVGIPLSVLLLSWGGSLVSNAGELAGDDTVHERRNGAIMLTAGFLALAGTMVSIWHVVHVRPKREAVDSELRALGKRRTVIERMIQAQLGG
jgi:hypothetical protein